MSVKENAGFKLSTLHEQIASLVAKKDSIDLEIEEVNKEILTLQSFLSMYDEFDVGEVSTSSFTINDLNNQISQYNQSNSQIEEIEPKLFLKTYEIIEMTYDYLKDFAPKNSNELVAYLEHSGRDLKGIDKPTYLSGILSKSDKFVARRKFGGWFLVEQDPEANKDESPTIGVVGDSIL